MSGPLHGTQVVELGGWVVGPSTAAILADWGADVLKVEPPDGDPNRAWTTGRNPTFELDNRGKRSMTLDVDTEAGRQVLFSLLEDTDVFVTNLRPRSLDSLGLDYRSVADRLPRLVYAQITGYGLEGPDRDRPAYDGGAFWARGGVLAGMMAPGVQPPSSPGGSGDHMTAVSTVAGIAAALVARQRTGRGQLVSSSLLRSAIYAVGSDLNQFLRTGSGFPVRPRSEATNPLYNSYRCRDGRYIFLLGLQPDRHWEPVVAALGRPGLLTDPRFATVAARAANASHLIAIMDGCFASADREAWAGTLDAHGVWWAPLQRTADLPDDPQVVASGAFVDVPTGEGPAAMVASPVDFSNTVWSVSRRAPEAGEHTEEVLLERGADWDQISELRASGAFGCTADTMSVRREGVPEG